MTSAKEQLCYLPRKGSKLEKAGLGVVCEVPLPTGYVYLHACHLVANEGLHLNRVLYVDKRKNRLTILDDLSNVHESFLIKCNTLKICRDLPGCSIVGTLPIPIRFKEPLVYVSGTGRPNDQGNIVWCFIPESLKGIEDMKKRMYTKSKEQMTPEELNFPSHAIESYDLMIVRLEANWSIREDILHDAKEPARVKKISKQMDLIANFKELQKQVATHWGRLKKAKK